MGSNNRQTKYELQTNELYAGLGEFVATFELIVQSMRTSLIFLYNRGDVHHQVIIQTALADKTAESMRSTFVSAFATFINQSEYEQEEKETSLRILNNLSDQIQNLSKTRNEIVHGTWFIGWASQDDTDFSVASGYKPINKKSGIEHRSISRTKEDFDNLIDENRKVSGLIDRFYVSVFHLGKASEQFIWIDKKVTLPPNLWSFKFKNIKNQ